MRTTVIGLVLVAVLGSSLTACKDTETLAENDRLKARVVDLQKQNGQPGNTIETLTAERDALAKENQALKAQVASLQTKKPVTKAANRKRRRSSVARS